MSMNEDHHTGPIGRRPYDATSPMPVNLSKADPSVAHQPQPYFPQPYGGAPQGYTPGYRPYPPPQFVQSQAIVAPAPTSGALVAVAWVVALLSGLYMLPWAIAATRNTANQAAVGLLNFFLGWTIIGWIIALVMACSGGRSNVMVVNQFNAPHPYR